MYIELQYAYEEGGEIIVDSGTYQIESINFAPQVDLTGNSLPVNEYTCDVILPQPLPGTLSACRLFDERNQLWCDFPLTNVKDISEKCIRVTCTSWLKRLEYRELEEAMYDGETAEDAIAACFGVGHSGDYTITNAIKSKTLTGFAPAQNARERLTWILFAVGAYANDLYRSNVRIEAVDESATLIPLERTFMRPSEDKADWVTGLKLTVYAFREGTEEEWQADDSSYMFPLPWLATTQTFTLTNPAAPNDAPENVIAIENMYLVNSGNVADIASRLANYWFNPTEVTLDCVNNRQYRPGNLVNAYASEDSMVTGYIQQASFRFGLQARSTLKLIGVEALPSDTLTVNYLHNSRRIGQATYRLPVGVAFSIENPYLDQTTSGHRYIYRPTTANAEGTMVEGGVTVNVNYAIALDLFEGVLHIISVDSVTQQESGGLQIGVIA